MQGTTENLPESVRQFVEVLEANARKAWGEDDKEFVEEIVYVERYHPAENGVEEVFWVISDNFEKFFSSTYYYYEETRKWCLGRMYSGESMREYSQEAAMSDADIMFTG